MTTINQVESHAEQMEALRAQFQREYKGERGGKAEHEAWNKFRIAALRSAAK